MPVTAHSRLDLNKTSLPAVRIQRRCPWAFPTTAAERQDAADDPESIFHLCGYSFGASGGNDDPGNPGSAFTSCEFTKANCVARGMYEDDDTPLQTGRFGGIQFAPEQFRRSRAPGQAFEDVEQGANKAKYNDFFPVVYGEQWVRPPVMNVLGDALLTVFEAVVSFGEVDGLNPGLRARTRVVVNDVEMFEGGQGGNSIAGFWNVVNDGTRNGDPNLLSFYNGRGDPYGNLATITVAVPRELIGVPQAPDVRVLIKGVRPRVYTAVDTFTNSFTTNPAWILADVLRKGGFAYGDLHQKCEAGRRPVR